MWSYFISCLQESWEQIPVTFVIENTTGWIQSLFAQYNLEIIHITIAVETDMIKHQLGFLLRKL